MRKRLECAEHHAQRERVFFTQKKNWLLTGFFLGNFIVWSASFSEFRGFVDGKFMVDSLAEFEICEGLLYALPVALGGCLALRMLAIRRDRGDSATAKLTLFMLFFLGHLWGSFLYAMQFSTDIDFTYFAYGTYIALGIVSSAALHMQRIMVWAFLGPLTAWFIAMLFSYPGTVHVVEFSCAALAAFVSAHYLAQYFSSIDAYVARLMAERGELTERLTALLNQDVLTGVANRHAFDQHMKAEVERARTHGMQYPLSLIVLDVDYFRRYNDLYGHQRGDQCLAKVAACLSSATREGDLVARIGGEAFAIILPRADITSACEVAQRFKWALEGQGIEHCGSDVSNVVTASQGVAQWQPSMNVAALYSAADKALYAAKRQGRNRIAESLQALELEHGYAGALRVE